MYIRVQVHVIWREVRMIWREVRMICRDIEALAQGECHTFVCACVCV